MPEAQRPPEIKGQKDCAYNNAWKSDVVTQPRQRTVLRPAKQIDQHGKKITSAGKAAEKKVHHDQPTPLRRGAKKSARRVCVHGRSSPLSSRAPRLRKLISPIRPTTTAPNRWNNEPDARLRVGIFGSGGKPYT